MDIKLNAPIINFDFTRNISQYFGENRAYYREHFGITAHNGIDIIERTPKLGYGEKIYSAHTRPAKVTKVFLESKTRTNGNGIYLQEELPDGRILETVYWHLSAINVQIGKVIQPYTGEQKTTDTVIGLVGNSGHVIPKPTERFPYWGSHCHFAVRVYPYKDYQFGGFVDPAPMLYREGDRFKMRLDRNLYWGMIGNDVAWLQTLLKIEFPNLSWQPTGYYGTLTRQAVIQLQRKYNLKPAHGFVGPLTRKHLADKYLI